MAGNEVKHLLNWKGWEEDAVKDTLKLSHEMKNNRDKFRQAMSQETLVMLFQKTSTRTRVSFEVAMTEMGGHSIYLDWMTTNFKLTRIEYETAYLSRNTSLIMARMKQYEELLEIKAGAEVPVINGCCNMYHPCQAMADMLTLYEDRGSVEGAQLTYIGVHNNVVNSLMALCSLLGVQLTLVCPVAETEDIDHDLKATIKEKGLLTETLDKVDAVNKADYVYTDTWINMEFFNNPEYAEFKKKRLETMLPYQINAELMKGSKAKILHDMPIHEGYEISGEMVKAANSLIFNQAENRLHVQKAIILKLCKDY